MITSIESTTRSNEAGSALSSRKEDHAGLPGGGVTSLHRHLFADCSLDQHEATSLFDLERTALTRSDAWTGFFVQAVTDYVVWGARPTGRLNEDQAQWLLARVDETRTPASFAISSTSSMRRCRCHPGSNRPCGNAPCRLAGDCLTARMPSRPRFALPPEPARFKLLITTLSPYRTESRKSRASHPADQDIANPDSGLALACLRLIDACRSIAHVSTPLPAASNGYQDGKFRPEARGRGA